MGSEFLPREHFRWTFVPRELFKRRPPLHFPVRLQPSLFASQATPNFWSRNARHVAIQNNMRISHYPAYPSHPEVPHALYHHTSSHCGITPGLQPLIWVIMLIRIPGFTIPNMADNPFISDIVLTCISVVLLCPQVINSWNHIYPTCLLYFAMNEYNAFRQNKFFN